jgi:predicted tellurium resistance membrane protein TerC
MAMDYLLNPELWASLLTLTALEIVLGVDNLVFVAMLAGQLPAEQQNRARRIGLALALVTRLALLGSITWIISLTQPLFYLLSQPLSWRDIVLITGGLFLLYKGTREIHYAVEGDRIGRRARKQRTSLAAVAIQIMLLDVVFSLDSVITAVGLANSFLVMATAIIIAIGIMLVASGPLAVYVERYPTIRMLALSFMVLIGTTLIADGAGFYFPRGYIYTAIAFSSALEVLNQLAARRHQPREHDPSSTRQLTHGARNQFCRDGRRAGPALGNRQSSGTGRTGPFARIKCIGAR